LWAVGTLFTLVTIALLVGLLVVNLDAVKWEDLSRERIEQVALFIGIAVALTTLFVLLAIGGASLGWTGFADKTFWDWLQLLSALAIPVVLAAAGLWFTAQQEARQQNIEDRRAQQAQKIENQRAAAERELAEQRAQDEALQAYLDQMSQLMLERKLLEAEQGDPVHTLAQARTSTIILRLDAEHNESVTRFLIDSGLAVRSDPGPVIVGTSGQLLSPSGASTRILSGIALPHATLSGAYLYAADLSKADLSGAVLTEAQLSGANLKYAVLSGANLSFASLSGANLSSTVLSDADLSFANLSGGADLSDAYLNFANLKYAVLSGANLSGANLNHAFLNGAILTGADGITSEELEQQAKTLKGATMPNGQKYEDWLKSKDQEENKKSDGSS
jgi:uncharacterized protein YjbI with pentapeptide repeats/membrane protein implicated in regulation of membrane protease activity